MSTDCTIFPAGVSAFSHRLGSSLLTLCRLAVGGFSFVRRQAGPGLGLRGNAVHILENTGKPPRSLHTEYSTLHSVTQSLILTVHDWVSNLNT